MINLIIPIYNVEPYLVRCLESVKAQNSNGFRAIMVDDGSTDDCNRICRSYADGDSRFLLLEKANGGLSDAIRHGILNAPDCDYFMFLDGDDALEPCAVETVEHVIAAHRPDLVMYDFYKIYDDDRSETVTCEIAEGLYESDGFETLKERYKEGVFSPSRCNKVFRADLVRKTLPFYDTRVGMGEDRLFTTVNLFAAHSLCYVKVPLFRYYQNGTSFMHRYRENYIDSYLVIYEKLTEYFGSDEFSRHVLLEYVKVTMHLVLDYGKSWQYQKAQLRRICESEQVKDALKRYAPTDLKGKVFRFLTRHKQYLILKILMKK